VLDRLAGLKHEHTELETRLGDPAVLSDQTRLVELSKRYKELSPIVDCIGRYERRVEDLAQGLLAACRARLLALARKRGVGLIRSFRDAQLPLPRSNHHLTS